MVTTKNNKPRRVELLAPARNADIAIEAIRHGADAVYIGAPSHGARSAAANSLDDISRAIDYAHRFDARVYITVNTLVYPEEIKSVERLVGELYRRGADALIVQDMALLRMDIPPIELHASTQCDIRTPEKAAFLQAAGFSQLVLPRELTLEQTAAIAAAVDVPLEAFVHGALCVSYSGDCQAGFATTGRSANRGECPQICRHRFDLTDNQGNKIIEGKHLLSLRDLNRSVLLEPMLEAGVTSFKIEGRLKDAGYVKNIVAYYRQCLDTIIDAHPDRYCRSSLGHTELTFTPDPSRSFNRGFTTYFTTGDRPEGRMASTDTPKWTGLPVGKAVSCRNGRITARLTQPLANGDGLGFFDAARQYHGFRLNRVEGDTLFAAQPAPEIPVGATLYRNADRLFNARMEQPDTARRLIDVSLTLRLTPSGLALDISDGASHSCSVATAAELQPARTDQSATRREVLSKAGGTDFRITDITDLTGPAFIPRSLLADLRRRATDALSRQIRLSHIRPLRRKEEPGVPFPAKTLSYHDNVANPLARQFYTEHGVSDISPALETSPKSAIADAGQLRVMTTRYCLRREFGRCLRTPDGAKWPSGLHLVSGPMSFSLDFDCSNCRMHLILDKHNG